MKRFSPRKFVLGWMLLGLGFAVANCFTSEVQAAIPCQLIGDTANPTCNNKVDVLDFSFLSSKFNTNSPTSDLDGNGMVNVLDYTILANNFGKTISTSPTPTSVNSPTPTATIRLTPTASPSPTPTVISNGNWWKPTPEKPIAWHWQLSQPFEYPRDVIAGVKVYDIDGEKTNAQTVTQLHALGPDIKVICYFDAGVWEDYRSDAGKFPGSASKGIPYTGDPQYKNENIIGSKDGNWEGSWWMDIRRIDILRPIMEYRIKTWCKDKGFDAVEPDETEVWSNNSGFSITKAQNNAFNIMIAELAHKYGLSVGLKGNTTETGDLVNYFDWTLNEECWEFQECDYVYNSFIKAGKAAFNIEYAASPNCTQANQWHMNSAKRDLNLMGPTHTAYKFSPCVPYSQTSWPN